MQLDIANPKLSEIEALGINAENARVFSKQIVRKALGDRRATLMIDSDEFEFVRFDSS